MFDFVLMKLNFKGFLISLSSKWSNLSNRSKETIYQHMYDAINKRFVFIIFGIAQKSLPTDFIYVFDDITPDLMRFS